MALTLARASWAASLILVSSVNSTMMLEMPSWEVEEMCLTPWMGLTASSISPGDFALDRFGRGPLYTWW